MLPKMRFFINFEMLLLWSTCYTNVDHYFVDQMCVFFKGGLWWIRDPPFFNGIVFACTCPNRSGVGEIDNSDSFLVL